MSNTYKTYGTFKVPQGTTTGRWGSSTGYTISYDTAAYFFKPSFNAPVEKAVENKVLDSNSHRSSLDLFMYPRNSKEGYTGDQMRHTISFSNIQELLAKFFLKVHYEQGIVGNWRDYCVGVGSLVQGRNANGLPYTRLMPILDYDGKGIMKNIRADIKSAQESLNLGPAWIYKTKRGYHVYFGADLIDPGKYMALVGVSSCCQGFKRYVADAGYGVLRLSAKYTEFDICFQELVPSPNPDKVFRKQWPATVAHEIIKMGQECGTHLASMFPKLARFSEDKEPWSPRGRVRRVPGHLLKQPKPQQVVVGNPVLGLEATAISAPVPAPEAPLAGGVAKGMVAFYTNLSFAEIEKVYGHVLETKEFDLEEDHPENQ